MKIVAINIYNSEKALETTNTQARVQKSAKT